jgi:hypothetical protein
MSLLAERHSRRKHHYMSARGRPDRQTLPHLHEVRTNECLCWIETTGNDIFDILLTHLLVMTQ